MNITLFFLTNISVSTDSLGFGYFTERRRMAWLFWVLNIHGSTVLMVTIMGTAIMVVTMTTVDMEDQQATQRGELEKHQHRMYDSFNKDFVGILCLLSSKQVIVRRSNVVFKEKLKKNIVL
jgi:hypothetical protein